ncbi:MAG: multicopper oxidase domain-containing protein [Propionibacteriales bacterium]|nr:multicopper oxidase domain-containing protein [Propionibacteriales bacterium]
MPKNNRPAVLRWFLRLVALGVVAALGVLGFVAWAWSTARVDTVGEMRFERPLAIPPLAESRIDDEGRRVFDLTAAEGTSELLPGEPTTTWGFNGDYLGPTLRAERGEQVVVNVRNELDETTSVHWHGMHLPAKADGGPHRPVEPGETWSPTWRIDQPAASLWYHPHPHGETEQHVYRGLAGMFILDDPDSEVADRLPHEYGVDDIPVIVQDKRFDGDGDLREGNPMFSSTGLLGEDLLVNGTYGPYLDVETERVRLRLLNASTARVYDFGFSDGRTFSLIGSDGGLLPRPVRTDHVRLSPAERAEIVVEMEPGGDVVLMSTPPDIGGDIFGRRFNGGADRFDVLELRAAERLRPSPPIPSRLAEAPDVGARPDAPTDRTFSLSGRSINGESMDMSRIDETVELGTTEVWEVENSHGTPHSFHIHDVQFDVLSVDGESPPPELSGWKDTIFLPPHATAKVAMRFTDYADPDTPYMYHCHLLKHEDQGMMGQFVVVEPGDEAGTPDHTDDGHDHDHDH